jgi:hypothetical protein
MQWYALHERYLEYTGCLQKRGIKELNIKTMYRAFQKKHRIFIILVSIPHNSPLIMEDRYKNFEDPMCFFKRTLHSFYIQFLNPPFFETPCRL